MTEIKPHPTAAAWAAARADYEAGDTISVIAERHNIHERTVFRHASDEGWQRKIFDGVSPGPRPVWDRRRSRRDSIAAEPIMEEINEAKGADDMMLLFDPTPADLRHFAFRRAAESAIMDTPQQAVVWMRLAQLLDRCGDRIDHDGNAFRKVDFLRGAYLERLNREIQEIDAEKAAEAAASDGPEMSV